MAWMTKEEIAKQERPFDKQQVIQDIKDKLKAKMPDWEWFVVEEGVYADFDLVLIRNKEVHELPAMRILSNPHNPQSKKSTYHMVYGIFVEQDPNLELTETAAAELQSPTIQVCYGVTSSLHHLIKKLSKLDTGV